MTAIFLRLDESVASCNDLTKDQVDMIQQKIVAETDEDKIITNLADNKHHVELMSAKMKMHSAMHEYFDFG